MRVDESLGFTQRFGSHAQLILSSFTQISFINKSEFPMNLLSLLADPELSRLGPIDSLLELEQSIEQALSSGGAARDIDINWDNPVASSHDCV